MGIVALPKWHRSPDEETKLRSKPAHEREGAAFRIARRVSHPGLRWDRFLPLHGDDEGRAGFLRSFDELNVTAAQTYDPYVNYYRRWYALLEARGATLMPWAARSRLVFGVGDESVLEVGIRLSHTYGFPVISGSAQKGLTRRFAKDHLGLADDLSALVFGAPGHTGGAGAVLFHDALWIPTVAHASRPFAVDVVTVHHPSYYQEQGEPPTDWNSPTPVSMLSARGKFLFALEGESSAVEYCVSTLAHALHEWGIGARTLKGYGRFETGAAGFGPASGFSAQGQATGAEAVTGDSVVAVGPPSDVAEPSNEREVEAFVTYKPQSGQFEVRNLPTDQGLLTGVVGARQEGLFASEKVRDWATNRARSKGLQAKVSYRVSGRSITITNITPQ